MTTQRNQENNLQSCPHCAQMVYGFHDCKKVLSVDVRECGCKYTRKYGFEDLFAVFQQEFIYFDPCEKHVGPNNWKECKNYKFLTR